MQLAHYDDFSMKGNNSFTERIKVAEETNQRHRRNMSLEVLSNRSQKMNPYYSKVESKIPRHNEIKYLNNISS